MSGWRKTRLDLAKAGDMLRDYAVMSKSDPLEAAVYRDRAGRHRRIAARYPDGWSLQVNFSLTGVVSSYALTCSLRGLVIA